MIDILPAVSERSWTRGRDNISKVAEKVRLEDLWADPYPILARLREHQPVAWMAEPGQWLVTRRSDVLQVLRDLATFTTDSPQSLLRDLFGAHMLSTEGAQQARYKRQCFPPFRIQAIRQGVSTEIEARANELVDRFSEESAAELRTQFCSPLALYSVARILGSPEMDFSILRTWYDDFAAALANFERDPAVRERGQESVRCFRAVVERHLHQLAAAPDNSLLSVLARASPDRLDDVEITSNALLILFGGIETTESMMLNALWALLTHRDQLDEVSKDRALLPNAIEETLRWETPVQTCTRYVTKPVRLGTAAMEPGQTVQCMLGSANRDSAHFNAPDRFDIHRPNASDQLSFGFGAHLCLGAALARQEAEIGLGVLFDRLPGLRMIRERSSPPRGHEFRKPDALYVEWEK